MKKIIIYSVLALVITFFTYLGYMFIQFLQFEKHTERMTSNYDKDITIVNTSELDRYDIAKAIDKIQISKPKILILDFCFSKDKGPKDSILVNTLSKYDNILMIYYHDRENYSDCSLPHFMTYANASGYSNFGTDGHGVRWFVPKIDSCSHVALIAAKLYDPSTDLSKLENNKEIDILYSRTLDAFNLIEIHYLLDENAIYNPRYVRDKIVIMGYTGPTEEDKYKTPMHYYYPINPKNKPDTYGCVIMANIIRQILDDY